MACDFVTSSADPLEELTKHMEDTHPDMEFVNEWIGCDQCGNFFLKLDAYRCHHTLFHGTGTKAAAVLEIQPGAKEHSMKSPVALEVSGHDVNSEGHDKATNNLDLDPTTAVSINDDVSLTIDLDGFQPMEWVQRDLLPKIFPTCEICDRNFVDSFQLKNHLADVHHGSRRQKPTEKEAEEISPNDEITLKLSSSAEPDESPGATSTEESTGLTTLDQKIEEVEISCPTSGQQEAIPVLEDPRIALPLDTSIGEHTQAGPHQAPEQQQAIDDDNNNNNNHNSTNKDDDDDDIFVFTHSCKKCSEEFASKLFLIRHLYKVHLKN